MRTAKEVGGSVRRRGGRKIVGATLGLAAAVSVGGFVLSNPAHATQLGTTTFEVSAPNGDEWSAGWGEAWSTCKRLAPKTRSVRLISSVRVAPGTFDQTWGCLDTP